MAIVRTLMFISDGRSCLSATCNFLVPPLEILARFFVSDRNNRQIRNSCRYNFTPPKRVLEVRASLDKIDHRFGRVTVSFNSFPVRTSFGVQFRIIRKRSPSFTDIVQLVNVSMFLLSNDTSMVPFLHSIMFQYAK